MAKYQKLRTIKDREEERLLRTPGVHAVGIGLKEVRGEPVQEMAISVFVERKKPLSGLASEEIVPPEISGVRADVVESGPIRTFATTYQGGIHVEARRYRGLDKLLGGSKGGTLGCFAYTNDAERRVVLLTNQHILMQLRDTIPVGNDVGPQVCSICSECCSDIIAKVRFNALNAFVDAGIAELKSGIQWLPEVKGIGTITGIHPIEDKDIDDRKHPYFVRKMGDATGPTRGRVSHIHIGGRVENHIGEFLRMGSEQIRVVPVDGGAFCQSGDSGSVLIHEEIHKDEDKGTEEVTREVVGLLFGGSTEFSGASPGDGAACPIDKVVGADFGVNIEIATTKNTPEGVVQVVPELTTESVISRPLMGGDALVLGDRRELLMQAQEDLLQSSDGRKINALIRKHLEEVRTLINTNRRVATQWHRSGGPAIINRLIHAVEAPEDPFPVLINGNPFKECVEKIAGIFKTYGSKQLVEDIDHYQALIAGLEGWSYAQLLNRLRTSSLLS